MFRCVGNAEKREDEEEPAKASIDEKTNATMEAKARGQCRPVKKKQMRFTLSGKSTLHEEVR